MGATYFFQSTFHEILKVLHLIILKYLKSLIIWGYISVENVSTVNSIGVWKGLTDFSNNYTNVL